MLDNILTNGMPTAVSVNGIPFDIYTDFRTWIEAGYLIQELSTTKDQNEVFQKLCDLVVKEYPKNYIYADDFFSALLMFYAGYPHMDNDSAKARKQKQKESPKPPSFDFVYDADYIYCSFLSFYGIRLQEVEYMHWWEFLTLFQGLMMSDSTSVNFVVGTRQTKIKSNMPKEEKKRIQRLQKDFALPASESEQKAKDNLTNVLSKMAQKNKKNKKSEENQ